MSRPNGKRHDEIIEYLNALLSREVKRQLRGRFVSERAEILQEAWAQLLVATGEILDDPTEAPQYIHTAVRHALRNHQAIRHDVSILTWEKHVRLLRMRYDLAEAGIHPTPQELAEISNRDDRPEAERRRRRQGRWIRSEEATDLMRLRYRAEVDMERFSSPEPESEGWLLSKLNRIANEHPRPQVRVLAADLAIELERCEPGQVTRSPRQVALDRMAERTAERAVAGLREALTPQPAEPHG